MYILFITSGDEMLRVGNWVEVPGIVCYNQANQFSLPTNTGPGQILWQCVTNIFLKYMSVFLAFLLK